MVLLCCGSGANYLFWCVPSRLRYGVLSEANVVSRKVCSFDWQFWVAVVRVGQKNAGFDRNVGALLV